MAITILLLAVIIVGTISYRHLLLVAITIGAVSNRYLLLIVGAISNRHLLHVTFLVAIPYFNHTLIGFLNIS